MEEVRQLVQEEGREARNLVAFHVSVDSPGNKLPRKPPKAPSQMVESPPSTTTLNVETRGREKELVRRVAEDGSCRVRSSSSCNKHQAQMAPPCNRVRSASTGRDKKSELQARYWGLLFGNLQRAIGEIYNIVEAHENMNECQEVILVLENYTRDFKSLCEWFRLKWEYDNTPPPQRPLSLAWEVRKTSPAKPEIRRARSSKSSPSISGKNSPCLSGKTSPCPSSGKNSPSMKMTSSDKISLLLSAGCLSPKKPEMSNAFFSKVEKIVEGKEMDSKGFDSIFAFQNILGEEVNDGDAINSNELTRLGTIDKADDKSEKLPKVEIGTATEFPSLPIPQKAVIVKKKLNKTSFVGSNNNNGNAESIEKESSVVTKSNATTTDNSKSVIKKTVDVKKKNVLSSHAKHTTDVLDALENEHLKSVQNKKVTEEMPLLKHVTDVENHVKEMNELNLQKNQTAENNNADEGSNVLKEFIKTITDSSVLKVADRNVSTADHVDDQDAKINKENDIKETSNKHTTEDVNKTEKREVSSTVAMTKPAYSQAASKPKTAVPNVQVKIDTKTPSNLSTSKHIAAPNGKHPNRNGTSDNKITRSKTIAEIKQGQCRRAETKNRSNTKQFTNRNAGSYPFNLTVGRGTFFESNTGRGNSGVKIDANKSKSGSQTARPNSLPIKSNKTNVPSDKNEKTLQRNDLKGEYKTLSNNLKPFSSIEELCSSSETLVNSRNELSHVESNESIKTLCPDDETIMYNTMFAGSVEVLNIIDDNLPNEKGGNDGWLTVKSRRLNKSSQSKKSASHWANRYNQPSATASLPTLNMIESPKDGNSKIKDFVKLEITVENNSNSKDAEKNAEEPIVKQKRERRTESKKVSNIQPKKNVSVKPSNTNILRQKSDVTGLKTRDAKDKLKNSIKLLSPKADMQIKNVDYDKLFKNNEFLPRSKKIRNKCIKMHFSYEDLSECKMEPDTMFKELKMVAKHEKSDNSEKNSNLSTVHLSLESLNSDSCFSASLEQITNMNDKLTLSDISIDTDSLKQNSLNKSSEVYDGDNDEEIKDTIDNMDSDANEIEMMTNQIEENERKMDLALDWQSEEDQRKLAEEEELLNQQIEELQKGCDFDMDTETDDTETDGEILCEEEEEGDETITKNKENRLLSKATSDWFSIGDNEADDTSRTQNKDGRGDEEMSLEDRYEPILANMNSNERMDVLAALESLVARDPGRAQQLHAKLSHSMRRRGSLQETLKRYQAKQARAEHHRRVLQKERSTKLQQLLTRVEDVKSARLQLIEEKRLRMEQRLQRAAENRDQRLKDIVRKAHDEDEKLREIAFIKQLEAANKRHDFLEQCREQTSRLREVRADRMRRLEEKAAKEAAVEERRKALETERMIKLDKMIETRRQREERVGRQQLQKEKERAQLAEEKARGRSERLSALLAAQAATAQALRRRISMKQKETARRHQETISQIKQKALELSLQRPDVGMQDVPRGKENKPVSEQDNRLKPIQENNKKTLSNSSNANKQSNVHEPSPVSEDDGVVVEGGKTSNKDKNKAQKKKLKKIKQRIITRGLEFEDTYEMPSTTDAFSAKSKMFRSINQIANIVQRNNTTSQLDATLANKTNASKNGSVESKLGSSAHSSMSDLSKSSCGRNENVVSTNNVNSHKLERFLGELVRIVAKQSPQEKLAWQRTGYSVLDDILSMCLHDTEASAQISSKCLMQVCDLYSLSCFHCPQNSDYLVLSNKIINLVDIVLQRLQWCVKGKTVVPVTIVLQHALARILRNATSGVGARTSDLVSYMLSSGLMDHITKFTCSVQNPALHGACDMIESSYDLLAAIDQRCVKDGQSEACKKMGVALKETDLAGALRSVYNSMMAPTQEEELSKPVLRIANAAMKLFTAAAEADLQTFQDTLAGNSGLQFRHIIARLLRHAVRNTDKSDEVLHSILPTIGYFAINNKYNQTLLSSGTPPCVIQQLSMLPFRYFSVTEHKNVLIPVLLASSNHCPRTKHLLEQEVSQQLLDDFKISDDGKKSKLVTMMTPPPPSEV